MNKPKPAKQCPLYWMSAPPVTVFRLTAPTGTRVLTVWHCAICNRWHAEFSEQRKTNNEHQPQED